MVAPNLPEIPIWHSAVVHAAQILFWNWNGQTKFDKICSEQEDNRCSKVQQQNIGILSDAAIMKTSEDFYLMHHLEELGHISKVQEVLCWDVLLHSTVWSGYFQPARLKNKEFTKYNSS